MNNQSISRKSFLAGIGRTCTCACVCALASSLDAAGGRAVTGYSVEKEEASKPKPPRSQERMEFTEKWAARFFKILDANLDAPIRKKIMMENGKACYLAWQAEANRKLPEQAITLEQFAQRIKERKSPDYRIEGNVIYFQYSSAAETGQASPENHCLCPMVETKPADLSPTFCLCSLGYVKEMHEQLFRKLVEVELVSSVLRGDPRCKFKITVL